MSSPFHLATPSLTLRSNAKDGFELIDNQAGRTLILSPALDLLCPVIDGKRCALKFLRHELRSTNQLDLHFEADRLESFVLRLEASPGEDTIDISCLFRVRASGQINRLEFFPEGTALDFYDMVNYRNRHHTAATWPELLLEAPNGCVTNTYSTDWQFAPHPTMFVFRKNELQLFFGAFDLPRAFGMYIDVRGSKVASWYLDLGDEPNGQPVQTGEEYVSARFRLFIRRSTTMEELLDAYGRMLIRAGQISDPANKVHHSWWREPLYCTWIDQVLLSKTKIPINLQMQVAVGALPGSAPEFVTDRMVRSAVDVIEREKLPFRTVLLDGGWHAASGQWESNPKQLPQLRALVDDLHAKGLKVVVWWNWAEIASNANVNPAELIGDGKLDRHGSRRRDYSLPVTQEYLRKLFHQLFSSDPGCYDLDGVKTDFLADKVHPDMPVSDPAWRGEESYFFHVTRLFYKELKRHKPDGIHIGCAGNFWLAEYTDINRTYDVGGTNHLQHVTRGRMLRHTTPGCPVAYDFHNYVENLDRYLTAAHENEASVQIGNILLVQEDPLSEATPPSPDYFALLRQELPFQKLKPNP
jgi:hypothetical protein